MIRPDKEITDQNKILEIFSKGTVCHLALNNGDFPYVVPLSYGYKDNVLYFHGAAKGLKLDLIRKNPNAGFCISQELEYKRGEILCNWGLEYLSIIGCGSIEIIDNIEEKRSALDLLMHQYGWDGSGEYKPAVFNSTTVLALSIHSYTAKGSSTA